MNTEKDYVVTYDPTENAAHWNFVHNKVMYEMNSEGNPDGDNGEGDCQMRSIDAHDAYGDSMYLEGIENCWELKEGSGGRIFHFGWRSPTDRYRMDCSRDHLIAACISHYRQGGQFGLGMFYTLVPWRFSFFFSQTLDIRLWANSLIHDSHGWRTLYYLWQVPQSLLSAIWNKLWCLILGIREVSQEEYISNRQWYLNQNRKKKRWLKLLPPIYSLRIRARMVEMLPQGPGKWMMRKILLWVTPRNNYFVKLLLGGKVEYEDVVRYRPMTRGRWSTSLDIRNDRPTAFRRPQLSEANRLDKDLIWAWYHKRANTQENYSPLKIVQWKQNK